MKVTHEPQKFTFTSETGILEQALSKLNASVSAGTGVREFALSAYKGNLWAIGYSSDSYAFLRLDGVKTSGDGSFLIDPATLSGVLKGRAAFDFNFTGSLLKYKVQKGAYNGEFSVALIDENQAKVLNGVSAPSKSEQAPITRDLFDIIRGGVSATNISDVFTGATIFKYIDISDKGYLTVFSNDQHHIAYYRVLVKDSAPFRLALPSSHFSIIDRVIAEEQANIIINAENIRIQGKSFLLVLPALQADEQYYSKIPSHIKSLTTNNYEATVDMAALRTLSMNFSSLTEKNTNVQLGAEKAKLSFTFQNRRGSASDSITAVSPTGKIKQDTALDIALFNDVVKAVQMNGEVQFSVGPRTLKISGKHNKAAITYVAALTSGG